ncbi:MAG: DNA topoisomerase VI subunit B [Phycisphaeraceae bacterium]|nr:MAG: DNA topoisomerase VI subunit B [Phycisphaeraceae bacterium]
MQTESRKGTRRSGKTTPRTGPSPRRPKNTRTPQTAEAMAAKQRDISVSEFFAKNRHLLGFDNPRKALLTTVKEAVDNALDACEEAEILPDISVSIEHLPKISEGRYRITVEDNGPGIVRKQIDNIFGKLLYGSKFHRLKMSRGQQGIGISAAGMYGLMTTGRPMVIVTRPKKGKPAHHVELAMDTTRNRPEVTIDVETDDFPKHTGTRVTVELEGRYMRGRTSIDEYLEQTAIANPHARIAYRPPGKSAEGENGAEGELLSAPDVADSAPPDAENALTTTRAGDWIIFPRTIEELPPEPAEIKPHPRGVELGALMQMIKQSEASQLGAFLQGAFCRVSPTVSKQICEKAGLTPRTWLKQIGHAEAEAIYKAIQNTRIMSPPLDCLAPIGTRQILAGLLKGVRAEFYTASTRPPDVYRGNPFQIEVGIAFGGNLPADQTARVIRYANRVPLLYQQSACGSFKAVLETTWRNYGLSQSRGALPEAPLVVMIHMASVWVPFTSESKEAIADYDEIRKEMKLALQECGRKLATYVRKRQRIRREGQRRDIFERYIGEVAKALHTINPELDPARIRDDLENVARSRTELADEQLEEDVLQTQTRDPAEALDDSGDTLIVETEIPGVGDDEPAGDIEPDTGQGGDGKKKKKKSRSKTGSKKKRSRKAKGAASSDDDDSLFQS